MTASTAHKDRRPDAPSPALITSRIDGLRIAAGRLDLTANQQAHEDLEAGLKLAILLEGKFDLEVEGQALRAMQGPSVSLFASRHGWRLDHLFSAGVELRFLTLHLSADLLADQMEFDLDRACRAPRVTMISEEAPSAMTAMAERVLHSPYSGPAAQLHAIGTGFELAALALDRFLPDHPANDAPLASPAETRRLHEMRAWLAEHYREVPTLDRLARQAGLNVRKLTAGFRRLFGMSVAEYLREVRLQEGRRLLESGCSVTDAADGVGYTLPHFTTVFQHRFGLTPRTLIGRDPRRSSKI